MEDSLLTRIARSVRPRKDRIRDIFNSPPQSFVDRFPSVPPPDEALSPIMLAARWSTHDLYGEDMPRVAADLLELGIDTPSLRRLAGETGITHSADVEPLVAAVFRELGVDYPLSGGKAELVFSRQVAREVIHGRRNAWDAAGQLEIANRFRNTPELDPISDIVDELHWDAGHGRSVSVLNNALIEAFARLAVQEI